MARYKLTVAIPTYNRPTQLRHTLSIVLPQILAHDDVQLLLLDNCSPIPAAKVLEEVANGVCLPERIKVVRHPSNIGGNPNIIRCFELAEGDWLWCLSDDDEPASDAINIILSDCRDGSHCYAFYGLFKDVPDVRDCRDRKYKGTSIEEWIRRIPAYGHRLFISSAIFNLNVLLKYLPVAYQVAISGAPHLTMAFLAILNGSTYLLSSQSIASYCSPVKGAGYNCAPLAYGSISLLALIGTAYSYDDFRRFYGDSFAEWISPFRLLADTIRLHGYMSGRHTHRCFAMIAMQFKPTIVDDPKSWLRWRICEWFSYSPKIFMRIIEWRYSRTIC